MTGDGLATTYQWTMATLCGSTHKQEAGPNGGGSALLTWHLCIFPGMMSC